MATSESTRYELTDEQIAELKVIKNNPGLVIEHSYSLLAETTDGRINVPDPTNPFSYVLELTATQAAMLHDANDALYRNQYPRLASEYQHLYNHMFDEDYIGRFATPGRAVFSIYFRKEEVVRKLQETELNGIRRIVIPRGSMITINDYVFTLLYPIMITQYAHGGIDILYNSDSYDPVQPLNSNVVDWGYVNIDGVEYIELRPMLLNVKLTQFNDTLTQYPGYINKWRLSERFCHCRVYQKINNRVEEIYTTHSDLVYDPMRVTAKLTYLDNELRVEIPSIYSNTGLLGTQIYVEVYQTAGKVEDPINEYSYGSFGYQWGKLENIIEDIRSVVPLEVVNQPIIMAKTMLSGGTNGETFEETRDRVINHAGYVRTPITPNQLKTSLRINGYDVLKSRDNITSRSYFATRGLPTNKYDDFTAGAAAAMETVQVTLEELASHPDVRDNGRRLTITPETLFKSESGVVKIVFPINNPKYMFTNHTSEEYIGEINKLQYMFTPFHYVVDPTRGTFDLRAYYFDAPELTNQIFVATNSSSGYNVSTDKVLIEPFYEGRVKDPVTGEETVNEGFLIRVSTKVTDGYEDLDPQDLIAQLAVLPHGENHLAAIPGKLLGYGVEEQTEIKEYVWEFKLYTNWDVTEEHSLVARNMYMYLNEPRKYEIGLTGEFYFTYGIKDMKIKGYSPNSVDRFINRQILDTNEIVAISTDKFTYRLGWHLKHFWANGIPVQRNYIYETYDADVPRVYQKDVYEIDSYGRFLFDDSGLKIKHRAGDPMMKAVIDPVTKEHKTDPVSGEKMYEPILFARKGDVKVNDNGEPIIAEYRKLTQLLDIMMVDGVYYFATDENDVNYRKLIGGTLKDYIVYDLKDIGDRLLENTLLYYYPKRTMGDAKLIVDDGKEIHEPMRMGFKFTYYLDEARYNNMDLREEIRKMTYAVINKHLENINVSTTNVIAELKSRSGNDIVAVAMDKFGYLNDRKFTTFTSKDPSVRCSVKRLARLQADKTIRVVEDIEVNFVKHEIIEELKILT